MAWQTPPTFVPLQTLTDTVMNILSDNLSVLFPYTTQGDLAYASAADALSRLPIGTAGQVLKVNSGATAPEWGAGFNVEKRQGGSASDWDSPGTTNYTPSASQMQIGVASVTLSGTPGSGSLTVTFPTAFNDKPIVLVSADRLLSSGVYGWLGADVSASQMFLEVNISAAGASYTPIKIKWLAIGDPA